MTILEAGKKFTILKNLISEYRTIHATIKFMEKDREAEGAYLNNLRKRRTRIENQFDEILK